MKRVPWILLIVIALVIGAALFLREGSTRRELADVPADTTPESTGSFKPAAADVALTLPKPAVVEIQDGKTIDFSSGLPIVKDSEKDKAALEAALKQMAEASADVSFGSPQAPVPEKN